MESFKNCFRGARSAFGKRAMIASRAVLEKIEEISFATTRVLA